MARKRAPEDAPHHVLITEIARDVIEEIAPDEVPMFSAVSDAYFADPRRATSSRGTRKSPLGFGSGAVDLILTPIVLAATAKAVECLADLFFKHTTGEGTRAALRGIFRTGRRSPGEPAPDAATEGTSAAAVAVELRQEDIERLRHVLETTLHDCGAAPDTSRLIADAVIGRCRSPRPTG
ncbi:MULTISPECIES: hypothetical protein [Streptomyces]|uniref:Uncharacterized protein n=2 Tax=Streptomyces TaxID=1883 RepID=A0ABS9JT16_9ACTN|nr:MULTISPECIES: hypothetical protein [Streptomyces]MCG0068695.1 hypothetical protein [Streptomyces tricolor]CUW32996.1 hypothetical protein TUE45_pSRTUE45c_0364 [Streptomyces reticuli]